MHADAMRRTYFLEIEMVFNGVSFHEATIVRFERVDGSIELELDEARIENRKVRFLFVLTEPLKILVDGASVFNLPQEGEDGEVLSLEVDNSNLRLLAEWHWFSPLKSRTWEYEILAKEIRGRII